ncbi:VOC family protein [Actinophytocola sp.]|jgi:hypothetical protein|uniref:VOC family protein n=1 Tax=Actinophytocola sp. TaxID=1872138 RepID=UPI002ED98DA4
MSAEINWFELPADDTAKARAFYGELFGWRTNNMFDGGDYHVIENGPVGAIVPRSPELTHPRVYFATDDIDAAVKRIHELGGTSEAVQDIPDTGRVVHCQDDQRTPFSLFQPQS